MSLGEADSNPGRLGSLVEFVPRGSRVADVGSGDGRLARMLLLEQRATYCVVTERTEERMRLLRVLPQCHPLADRFELRSGNGLDVLRPADRVDVLVLAGLGARAICGILGRADLVELGLRRLVLQPQSEPGMLRRWLDERGLGIVEERLVSDRGRIYAVIVAEPIGAVVAASHRSLKREEWIAAGPRLLDSGDPLMRLMWQREFERYRQILGDGAAGAGRRSAERGLCLARRVLESLSRTD